MPSGGDGARVSAGLPRLLVPVTLAYLVAPHVLFLVTWIRPSVGVVAAGGLAAVSVLRWRSAGAHAEPLSWRAICGLVAFAAVLTWLSGAGDIGYQAGDWWKHNAVFTDLVQRPWPVVYDLDGARVGLDYYLAHYLPAAGVGKLAGFTSANVALVVWTALGLVLVGAWVVMLVERAWGWALTAFVALAGFDALGWLLMEPLTGAPAIASIDPDGPEFWSGNFAWLSQLSNVADAPHQSMGIWLLTSLTLWFVVERGETAWLPLLFVVSPFWSVFATIGLLPFAALAVLRSSDSWRTRASRLTGGWSGVLLVPSAAVFLAYFGARTAALPDSIAGGVDVGIIFTDPRYDIGAGRLLVTCALFLLVELVLPLGLVRRFAGRSVTASEAVLARVAIATLLLTLPIKVSANHDLMLRGTGPALFVLTVVGARLLARTDAGSRARSCLLAVMVLGATTNGVVVVRALTADERPVYSAADPEVGPDLVELFGDSQWLSQYVAGTDSLFWSTLARD